ncbi:MAG: HAD-IA family hydrolase [Clostridia bacterium]|nr:HAD-IA family hydrolase [Clostridia bacterium]
MFLENELKIRLDQSEYNKILSFCNVTPTLQTNHYFDTTSDLSQMLRIRQKGDKFGLQYKKRGKVDGNVFCSQESGVEVDKSFLNNAIANGLDKDFVNKTFGCNFTANLQYLGCGKTWRAKFDFFGHEIEIDKTVIDDKVDFELEYESDNDNIQKLAHLLQNNGITLKQSCAKYQRFLISKGILKMQKKYNAVLLDLDGTISNTYRGIVKCLAPACAEYGADLMQYDVRKFIGPPLSWTFGVIFPDQPEKQQGALIRYRELYNAGGMFDNDMYEGIDDFAQGLRDKGIKVGVATSKLEKYAVEVLRKLGMLDHVDFVCGCESDRPTKADVINYALKTQGIKRENCLMIGDTFYDLQGAEIAGMDAVGVLYGFGTREEMEKYPNIGIVDTVQDLKNFVYPLVDKNI